MTPAGARKQIRNDGTVVPGLKYVVKFDRYLYLDPTMTDDFNDTSADDLLSDPTPFKGDVLDPQIESLPLNQLTWINFEKLCARLIHHCHDVRTFRYGRSGQKQEGIDITWRLPNASKRHVAQVKHWKQIKAKNITDWVKAFEGGRLCHQTQKYILCLSTDIEHDRDACDAWDAAVQQLAEKGIDAELWDRSGLVERLRGAPQIVQTFFSKAIRERFCHELPMPEPKTKAQTFRRHFCSTYEYFVTLENTTVRLEVLLPSEKNLKPSAILSFGRQDLSGIILGLDSEELVSWLQWANHYREGDVPFAPASHTDEQQFILCARQSRLTLEKNELDDLVLTLKQAWPHYLAAIEALEKSWQVLRFKPLRNDSRHVYALYSVSRPLWRVIVDYMREHHYSKGDSPEHIFENPGNGTLKVFVPRSTESLDAGYHLITYVYVEGGLATGLHVPDLTLGWSSTTLHGGSTQWSPRKQWNAEFTHHWFAHVLMPRVLRWYSRLENQKMSWLDKLLGNGNADYSEALADHFYSAARISMPNLSEFCSAEQTISCLHQMQSHFSMDRRHAPIEPELQETVIKCVEELAHKLSPCHHAYVKSNLGLGSEPLGEGLRKLLATPPDRTSVTQLEMALRSIICCCETGYRMTDIEYRWLTHTLTPLWLRMREDMLCDMFC
jgi:hypothetical protein